MTAQEYVAALERLALTPHSATTRTTFGISKRQAARYAAGDTPIPAPFAKLLRLMLARRVSAGYVARL